MTPRQFYYAKPKSVIHEVATGAGTTFGNFKQIAIAGGSCGKALAERLCESSGGVMSELEILYPERFEQDPAA